MVLQLNTLVGAPGLDRVMHFKAKECEMSVADAT